MSLFTTTDEIISTYKTQSLQPQFISMIEETLVFGKGLIKSQTDSNNLQLPVSAKELGVKVTDILGNIYE